MRAGPPPPESEARRCHPSVCAGEEEAVPEGVVTIAVSIARRARLSNSSLFLRSCMGRLRSIVGSSRRKLTDSLLIITGERTFGSDVNVGLLRQFPESRIDVVDFAVSMLTTTALGPNTLDRFRWNYERNDGVVSAMLASRCGGGALRERSEGLLKRVLDVEVSAVAVQRRPPVNCLDSPRRSARFCDCDASARSSTRCSSSIRR
jgi:hypothetical protein